MSVSCAGPPSCARLRRLRSRSATLGAAACGRGAGADANAQDAPEGGSADAGTQTTGQRAADSLAAWRHRFGNRVPRPDSVRALYVNAWAAGSRARMAELIRLADQTEITAFVIDIKESDTYLAHDRTEIPLAKEIGADQRPASRWLPALVETLQAHGIYPIARIVVLEDRKLAELKPELAIRHVNGSVRRDTEGGAW